MWTAPPQLRGLGRSPRARRYGIADAAEAAACLAHPILGARLRSCVRATLAHRDRTPREIFGAPDDLKFRSCPTLFEAVSPPESADAPDVLRARRTAR